MNKYVVLIAVLLLFFSTAHATIWYVHPDSALNSIQAALDSCTDNDTVLVGPGTYYENIIWPNIQGIDLISELGPDMTIIDGNNAGRVIEIAIGIDSSTVINGFTVRNGKAERGGGIASGSVTVTNNTLTGNIGDGIHCWCCGSRQATTIAHNTITENVGDGIDIKYGTPPNIVSNTITGNTGLGIRVFASRRATIANNTITGNMDGGIKVHDETSAAIANNIVTGNTCTSTYHGGGITLGPGEWGGGGGTIANNIITGNKAIHGGGIRTGGECVSAIIVDNTIADNTATQRGGGIYFGFEDYGGNYVKIMNNVITGNIAACGGGIGIWAVFHYFGNYEEIIDNTITDNTADFGGGIWFSDSVVTGDPRAQIANNTITDNTAPYGGGILCTWFSTPWIKYCIISANNGDGVLCDSAANPTINYNDITDNIGYGVRNIVSGVTMDATLNWWGDTSGPGGIGPGTGDEVSEWVSYADWFTRPVNLIDTADFNPNTFNKKRHGKWVTVYLEMRDGINPADISYIHLFGNLPGWVFAAPKPTCVGDYDNDGVPDRMVKFDSDKVNEVLGIGDSVEVTIKYRVSGYYNYYYISDYIRVIEPEGPQSAVSAEIPEFKLASIHPNPFSRSTVIRFGVSHSTYVTLKIFDISGRLIKTLVNRVVDSGMHTTHWNARDNAGRKLPSGVYFLKFEVGDFKETEKLILLR